jgi:hypothetical protein
MGKQDKKIGQDEYSTSIDSVRQQRGLRIGESKLFDDLYEASQEGSPLYESISQMDQPPICETVGDMRELMVSEPERLLAVVHRVVGYIDAEHVSLTEVIPEKGGNFSLVVQIGPNDGDLRQIKVDAMGYPVTAVPHDD